jgi:hypothetical protein
MMASHPEMYVLVTGSRDWTDDEAVREELNRFPEDAVLVHGGCRGADTIAATTWTKMRRKVIACPVTPEDWRKHGKAAGPMRNIHMVENYPIDRAVAFRISHTGGTAHTAKLLRDRGIPLVERWPGERKEFARDPVRIDGQATIDEFFGATKTSRPTSN